MSLEDFYRGNNPEGISGSDEEFRRRVEAMFEEMPAELQGTITIKSAYRSIEEQEILYERYLAGEGNLAAPPGKSNHNHGRAFDLTFHVDAARLWAHDNAERFGLNFPIASEAWHIEPLGLRDGTYNSNDHSDDDGHDHSGGYVQGDPDAYEPGQQVNNNSIKTQLLRVADIMNQSSYTAQQRANVVRPQELARRNEQSGVGDYQ